MNIICEKDRESQYMREKVGSSCMHEYVLAGVCLGVCVCVVLFVRWKIIFKF